MSAANFLRLQPTGILEIAARRGRERALGEFLNGQFGIVVPAPCRVEISVNVTTVWIAPSVILILSDGAKCGEISAAISNDIAAINDQSAGYQAMYIELQGGASALASHCRLDLAVFAVGHAARCSLGQIPIVLWRPAEDRYGVLVPQTLARSFVDTFTRAIEH